MKVPLCLSGLFGIVLQAGAATSLGVLEPSPAAAPAAQVQVRLDTDASAVALQADVLFNDALYSASDALPGTQPDGVQVHSRLIEPGRLRVLVYHRSSGALASQVVFRVPLAAKAGVVSDDPVVLADFRVAGQGGSALSTGLQPKVRLLGLKDGQAVNGRQGIELTASTSATDASISRVEYYVGGVLVGEGEGASHRLLWEPATSGPFEISAVAYDSNGLQASTRTIPIVITHVGTYTGPVLGTYAGLVRGAGFSFAHDGYVSMTSTTAGAFTLKLMAGGRTYAASGRFDAGGNATVSLARGKGLAAWTVVLAHSSTPPVDQIHGRIADGSFANGGFTGHSFQTEFVADRLVWNAKTRPAPQQGSYTLLFPPEEDHEAAPAGTGFGTFTVAANGSLKLSASLADGTKATAATWLSKDGDWPLYASLYKAQGVLTGPMAFRTEAGQSDADGTVTWLRPADPKAPQFKDGFETELTGLGGRFTAAGFGQRLIPLANLGGNATLLLSGGGLEEPLLRLATVSTSHQALVPLQGAERAALKFTAAKGLFTGSLIHPDTQKSLPFQGAVLQPQGLLAGYFLGGARGGDVRIGATSGQTPATAPIGGKPLPVVKITAPKAGAALPPPLGGAVRVQGTAADAQGIAGITWQVLHNGVLSAPQTAAGTAVWHFDLPVAPGEGGLYTVHVKAADTTGQESEIASSSFRIVLQTPLTVSVSGPGSVTRGFLGTTDREVGSLITLQALPVAKKRFLGWTGSVTSSAAKITLLMHEGTQLEAHFSD